MKKILVIDDDEKLLRLTETALKREDWQVLLARDGTEGLRIAFNSHPDLVILDIMLPGMDGFETCRRLKELSNIPVIMLTALASETDVVRGLAVGADDYITKPFSLVELVARVRTCFRRNSITSSKTPLLVKGDLTIDLARHKVSLRGKSVDLTPTEFRLLSFLARNEGQVIPHRTLLVEVWGPEYSDQVDYLHLYIRYLRHKIEQDPSKPEIIKTERGIGYFLDGD
ncbi:MAG: response regulator transcription factor [Chloroflexi bacterium]|nr:response regulator transcription factor [Chloroflexota bacterium]